MALEKEIVNDKIEILEDGTIQIREVTRIVEDGVIISQAFTNRRIIEPGDDTSHEDDDIKNTVKIFQTDKKITKFLVKKQKIEKHSGVTK